MKSLGQIGFEAYNKSKRGVTWDGRPIPQWDAVGSDVRSAWEASGQAILEATPKETMRRIFDEAEAQLGAMLDHVRSERAEVLGPETPEPLDPRPVLVLVKGDNE